VSQDTEETKKRTKHRWRPGTVAARQVRKLQKSTDLLITKLPFKRLVREVLQKIGDGSYLVSKAAYAPLQEAAEAHVLRIFQRSVRLSHHRGAKTVTDKDFLEALKEMEGTEIDLM